MLNRQKLVLEMLRLAGRPVSKMELVNWAFVLNRETPTHGGDSFYEFLPYLDGPESFSMQRELGTLAKEGLIEATETSWRCQSAPAIHKMPSNVRSDTRRIVDRFQHWSTDDVTDYVKHTYPAYTVNSQRDKLAERKVATPAVYTAGYEGLQIDGFLDLLIQHGIQRLLDVRNNPVARRFGFHKSTLNRLCGLLGIEYVHLPQLGIISEERQHLETASDYSKLFDSYERITLVKETVTIDHVADLMNQRPSVLVCMEAEACRCHRSRLGAEVAQRTKLPMVHLGDAH